MSFFPLVLRSLAAPWPAAVALAGLVLVVIAAAAPWTIGFKVILAALGAAQCAAVVAWTVARSLGAAPAVPAMPVAPAEHLAEPATSSTSVQRADAREHFLINVVHELRTPLALIHGPLQQLMRAPHLDAQARTYAQVAHGNCLRLLNVADDLLALARIEHDRNVDMTAPPVAVDAWLLDEWLATLVAAVAHHPGLGSRPLIEQRDAADATLTADPAQVERVLLNLLANAIKFSEGRGSLRVGSFAHADVAGFWVEDDGIGIDPADHERVFERFRQLDASATRRFGGVGIGLALARAWVRAMGGDITVRSARDQGARFTVTLPRGGPPPQRFLPSMNWRGDTGDTAGTDVPAAFDRVLRRPLLLPIDSADPGDVQDEHATNVTDGGTGTGESNGTGSGTGTQTGTGIVTEAAMTRTPTIAASPARVKVLVIEDEPQLRWVLVEALRDDFEVQSAADGEVGLALALTILPDVVLTDWMLPGRDGLSVARALRASAAGARLRIAMITARLGEAERLDALAAGIDDFVAKPFSMAELKARLRNLGRRAQAERALHAAFLSLGQVNRELADTRAQMIQDEKLKSIGVLAAGLIHEINNPVSYMRTAAELLGREASVASSDNARELVATLAEGLARVGALVSDLRVFAYPGAAGRGAEAQSMTLGEAADRLGPSVGVVTGGGAGSGARDGDGSLAGVGAGPTRALAMPELHSAGSLPAAQRVDLRDTVASALRLASGPLQGIDVQSALEPAFVLGAPGALVQIVVNLLDNAARALRLPGEAGNSAAAQLNLVVAQFNGTARIEVVDNGPGIHPDVRPRLFEPFFTTRDVGQGLGLGLALSQTIARAHGGLIEAHDVAPHGSRFVLTLPAVV